MDLPAILAIIGGIALLVGILGGGVEAKEIKIPSISRQAQSLSSVLGIALIGISIFIYLFLSPTTQQENVTDSPTMTATGIATQITALPPVPTDTQVSLSASPFSWELIYKSPKLARSGMASSYDVHRQLIVMFGGLGKSEINKDILLAETWEFDGDSWYQVNTPTTPSPRKWFGMAYDLQRKVVVIFGGNQNQSLLNDTWEYDGNDWKLIQTAISPPPLSEFGFVYDTCRHKTVLFGGRNANGLSRSTWEYDGNNWEEITTLVSPPMRFLPAMAFDSNRCQVVLFGGGDKSNVGINDTWEYDGSNWLQKSVDNSPSPRWAHFMVFNLISGKIVLFGGYGAQFPGGNVLQDTWEYDGQSWKEVFPEQSPAAREQHILAFDGNRNLIILFGSSGDGDTWRFSEK